MALTNETIICISSIDWDFIWQGHQEIMSYFAKNGNKVLFIENTGIRAPNFKDIPRIKKRVINFIRGTSGIREAQENLFVYSPIALPLPYSSIIRPINRYLVIRNIKNWLKVVGASNPIIWTYLPTNIALDIIESLEQKKLSIYYCVAEFTKLVKDQKKVELAEKKLLKKCDLVFAQGVAISDKCSRYNKHVYIFPAGVNHELFMRPLVQEANPVDSIENIKGPIIGYVGGVHKHVDTDLLVAMAKKNPSWTVVMIGPMQINSSIFSGIKNIVFLGKKDHQELPLYIRHFDVSIIPYLLNDYTRTVYPTKLMEYLIMGKPVVTTPIPEIEAFDKKHPGIISVAKDSREFINAVSAALKAKDDDKQKDERVKTALGYSWGQKIKNMEGIIEDSISRKLSERTLHWREGMVYFYRRVQKRALKITFIAFVLWILFYKTPFIWIAAQPLQINDNPGKADAILVLAGGVGESGHAGQGTEERVGYALELYKDKYADNIIFSSGYSHIFKEPEVMRAIALSFGIPEKNIFIEPKAANTYENIKYSKDILLANNFNKVIIISSPYHMRRISLVADKLLRGYKIFYCPVPNSLYFGNKRKIEFKHIRSILHEYFGIAYYAFKNYI